MQAFSALAHVSRISSPRHITDKRFPPDTGRPGRVPYLDVVLGHAKEMMAALQIDFHDAAGNPYFANAARTLFTFDAAGPVEQKTVVVGHKPDYEEAMEAREGSPVRIEGLKKRLRACIRGTFHSTKSEFKAQWELYADRLNAERLALFRPGNPISAPHCDFHAPWAVDRTPGPLKE